MAPSDHIHRWNPFTDQTSPGMRNNWSILSFAYLTLGHVFVENSTNQDGEEVAWLNVGLWHAQHGIGVTPKQIKIKQFTCSECMQKTPSDLFKLKSAYVQFQFIWLLALFVFSFWTEFWKGRVHFLTSHHFETVSNKIGTSKRKQNFRNFFS